MLLSCPDIVKNMYWHKMLTNVDISIFGCFKSSFHIYIITANKAAKWATAVWITPVDIFKDTWGYFCFWLFFRQPKEHLFFTVVTKSQEWFVFNLCNISKLTFVNELNIRSLLKGSWNAWSKWEHFVIPWLGWPRIFTNYVNAVYHFTVTHIASCELHTYLT